MAWLVRPTRNEYLGRLISTLGVESLRSIGKVVLAGGGARMLLPAVQEQLGDELEIVNFSNSQFAIANVDTNLDAANAQARGQHGLDRLVTSAMNQNNHGEGVHIQLHGKVPDDLRPRYLLR